MTRRENNVLLWYTIVTCLSYVRGQQNTSWPCAVNGAAFGNIYDESPVLQWAPLVGKACANSGPNTCYWKAIVWSSIALLHGNRPVPTVEDCASLCAQVDECDVWTFWPRGTPDSPGGKLPPEPKCDLCPISLGGSFEREQGFCNEGDCGVCSEPYEFTAANGIPDDAGYSCEDARMWFQDSVGCCNYDEQAKEAYQVPATCELYRVAPNNTNVLAYGLEAVTGPKDCSSTHWLPFLEPVSVGDDAVVKELSHASDGRLCWVDNSSYGSAKDGACAEADIVDIYAHPETIELGRNQGWWNSPITGLAIEPIPYDGEPFTVSDCHQACIDNPKCGGWQFQSGSCVLKAALNCSPTIVHTALMHTAAGVSGCVDASSDDPVEQSALDTSSLWFFDCTRPRCTQPYSHGGRWASDTYVPDFKNQDACWYKQYTPDELFGGCVQDRWIIINGGSNSLSFFIQMVNLFAPLQRMGDPEPLIDFGYDDGVNHYPMIDIIFRHDSLPIRNRTSDGIIHFNRKRFCDIDASLPCSNRSLDLPENQIDWSPAYGAALKSFLADAPYEAGATRLTLVVGQFWSAAKETLRAVGSLPQSSRWVTNKVLFYGQAMQVRDFDVRKIMFIMSHQKPHSSSPSLLHRASGTPVTLTAGANYQRLVIRMMRFLASIDQTWKAFWRLGKAFVIWTVLIVSLRHKVTAEHLETEEEP